MIITKIHQGSGLGNSLHSYLMGRILALDKGFDFSVVGKEYFKGNSFMNFDWGKESNLEYHIEYPAGKLIVDSPHTLFEEKTDYYNPEINFVEDGTVIDGYWQDPRYFEHRLDEVREWLKVEPLDMPDDVCIIAHRGGEFAGVPELYLPKEYWDFAISEMQKVNPNMKFQVQSDDKITAQKTFPQFEVIHDIGYNWRAIRHAPYLIVANSSFSILPSLLGNARVIFAPKYHARHNIGEWSMPQNYYKRFSYIDRKQYI